MVGSTALRSPCLGTQYARENSSEQLLCLARDSGYKRKAAIIMPVTALALVIVLVVVGLFIVVLTTNS